MDGSTHPRSSVEPVQALTEADMRPGERLLDGRRYVYNAEALNDHLAWEAVLNPPDLTALTETELRLLSGRCVRVWGLSHGREGTPLQSRVQAELAARKVAASKARAAA